MRNPDAIWKPLPEHDSQPLIKPTQAIVHSIVGSARGAYGYFYNNTALESHFILTKAGELWQIMSTLRSADANYKANRFYKDGVRCGALSLETEDNGDPDNDPWTQAQVDAIIDWFRWANRTFGIPLHNSPFWDAPGIGYHTLFPTKWTNARGKTCPGSVRINQYNTIIVPALAGVPMKQEDDMKVRIAWLRPKRGSNENMHCYKFTDVGVATWLTTHEEIKTAEYLGAEWTGPLDPHLWLSLEIVNGPLRKAWAKATQAS